MTSLNQIVYFDRNIVGEKYGIELEMEGQGLERVQDQKSWSKKADGSLRRGGVEFVTRRPVSLKGAYLALSELSVALSDSEAAVDNSVNCSSHVHMNVQDLTLKDILQIVILYYIFEDWLVDFSAGPERVGNLFCLRLTDSELPLYELRSKINKKSFPAFEDNIRSSALNFCSLSLFGTLEFRSFRGVSNPLDLSMWLAILSQLRESALKKFSSPEEILYDFSMLGLDEFVKKVFKPVHLKALGPYKERDLIEGMRRAQILAFDTDYSQYDYQPKDLTDEI